MTNLQLTLLLICSFFVQNQINAQASELIRDLAPGLTESRPENLIECSGKIFFFADDGSAAGRELWRTDGTAASTELIGDLNTETTDNSPAYTSPFSNPVKLNNAVYWLSFENFGSSPQNGDYHIKLWRAEATGQASLIEDFSVETFNLPMKLEVFNNKIYLVLNHTELWSSDGIGGNASQVFDGGDDKLLDLSIVGNELFFYREIVSQVSVLQNKKDAYKTDGTTAGTVFVKRIVGDAPVTCGFFIPNLFELNGGLAYTLSGRSVCSYETWLFADGFAPISEATAPIADLGVISPILKDGKIFYLTQRFTGTIEYTLKVLDDTGTPRVIKHLGDGANDLHLMDSGDLLFRGGNNLWVSDGTEAGTKVIRDFSDGDAPQNFIKYGNEYIFTAAENHELAFWITDGTVAGTRKITSFPTANTVNPYRKVNELTLAGSNLYFSGDNGFEGKEMWKFDLTTVTPEPICTNNLMVNPGFENGLDGWQSFGGVTAAGDANSGAGAARIEAGGLRMFQLQAAEPDKEYTVRAKAKSQKSGTIYIKFLTADWQPNGKGRSQAIFGNYSPIEYSRTAPPNTAWIEVSFYSSNEEDLLIDDVCLSVAGAITPPLVCDGNLISNGDFEGGLTDWTLINSGTFVSDLEHVNSGNNSVEICNGLNINVPNPPISNFSIEQRFSAEAGAEYELSFYVKNFSNELCGTIYFYDADGNRTDDGIFTNACGEVGEAPEFLYKSYSEIAPPGTVEGVISFYSNPYAGFTRCGWVDDVCVKKIADAHTGGQLTILGEPCPLQYPSEGSTITVPFTVKNTGDAPSDIGKIHLYRGRSCRFCSHENLGQIDIPVLQPNEEVNLEIDGTMRGLIPGMYNVHGRLDQNIWGDFFLSDEVAQFPRRLKDIDFYCQKFSTDLEIEVIPVNSEYDNSGELSFRLKAKNNGNQAAYNSKVVFLDPVGVYNNSLDAVVQTAGTTLQSTSEGVQWVLDPLLPNSEREITVTYQMLGPGQFMTLPNSFTVSANISSGHNTDTNAGNNSDSFLFTKETIGSGGDLNLTAVGSSNNVNAWQFASVDFTIINEGVAPMSDIRVSVNLPSGKITLKGGDEYTASQGILTGLGGTRDQQWEVGTLLPGETATLTLNVFTLTGDEIPVYGQVVTATGNDSDSTPMNGTPPTPNEDDEAVFVFNGSINPPMKADLTIDNLNVPATITPGGQLSFSFNVKNIGDASAPAGSAFGAYLSSDNQISSDDTKLVLNGSTGLDSDLSPFETAAPSGFTVIPANRAAGNYYIIFKVDDGEILSESNEQNNTIAQALTIETTALLPDLVINNLFLDQTTVKQGEVLFYKFDLANIGTANIPGNFNVRAYLSTDGDLTSDDVQDGIVPTGNFDAGFIVTDIPGASTVNLPQGDYYLILKADADNQVIESDETNNEILSFIQFSVDNGTTNPTVCDQSVGNGELSCFEPIAGSDNYLIAYDSAGYQIEKILDANLGIISSTGSVAPLADPILEIDTTSLSKINGDGSVAYVKTLPQSLVDSMPSYPHAIEFGNGYVFLAWRGSPDRPVYSRDRLFAIRTDADFNILYEKQVAGGAGDPYSNRNGIMNIIAPNRIAFTLNAGYSTAQSLSLILIDETMELLDQENLVGSAFAVGGSLKENICDRFTVTDNIGWSYCKSGGCYAGHIRDISFENSEIQIENSAGFDHRTTLGRGSETWTWFSKTTDGGSLSGSRIQQLDWPTPAPLNEFIHLVRKDANANTIWEKDVRIPDPESVERIFEDEGRIFIVKNLGGNITISDLDCYDTGSDGVDLELAFLTLHSDPAQWSFFNTTLTVVNKGTEPATGVQIHYPHVDEITYKGGDEYHASQGEFQYWGNEIWSVGTLAPGESATLDINYFRLSANDFTAFAEVSSFDQIDVDSSPGNGVCCTSNEDDEAILMFGSGSGNAVNNRNNLIENLNQNEFAVLSAYPNPVFDEFTIQVYSKKEQETDMVIFDVLGKPVLQKSIELKEGLNLIPVEAIDLPSGFLTVKMTPWHPYLRQVRVMKMRD